jgi:hypothetical protein
MAWAIATPSVGFPSIGDIDDSAKVALGTVVRAVDLSGTQGEGEFIYLKGVNSTVAGDLVTYGASFQTALATTALDTPTSLAVATAAIVADKYGWYQIGGLASVRKSGSLCLVAGVKIGATSGAAVAAASANYIHGAVVAVTASVVSPAKTSVLVTINRPHGPADT